MMAASTGAHLVDGVPQAAQLVHAAARLHVGVVARADGAHARRLVPRVALRAVLEVAVGAARAVHADRARCRDVRTPGLATHQPL